MTKSNLKIHYGSSDVDNASFYTIDYSAADFHKKPFITATADDNINVFVISITTTSAVLNFSDNYTGTVNYIVMSPK